MKASPTDLTLEALGVVIRVEAVATELAEALTHAWSRCVVDGDAQVEAIIDARQVPPGPVEARMESLTQMVTVTAITQQAGRLLMLHACVLAEPDTGDAVVFVGKSGVGKTTLSARLAKRWAYVTDETAGIASDGAVLPYPKPLSVQASVHPGKDQVAPGALGLVPLQRAARVRGVVLLERDPLAVDVTLTELPTVEAIALLAPHTSFLSRLDRPLHRLASLLHSVGGAHRVTYAEADDLDRVVEMILCDEVVGP